MLLPVGEFYVRKTRPNEKINICKKCTCEKAKEYRRLNPEKIREISLRGRQKNREKIRERNREYYQRNKGTDKYKDSVRRTIEKHGDEWKAKERERRKFFNERWKHPCEKCGESRLYLIQFHHIDPATKAFCIGANATWKHDDVLIEEVKKCVCLCSNCHDEFHYFYGSNPKDPIGSLEEYLGRKVGD